MDKVAACAPAVPVCRDPSSPADTVYPDELCQYHMNSVTSATRSAIVLCVGHLVTPPHAAPRYSVCTRGVAPRSTDLQYN
jgi:hypothetical protein